MNCSHCNEEIVKGMELYLNNNTICLGCAVMESHEHAEKDVYLFACELTEKTREYIERMNVGIKVTKNGGLYYQDDDYQNVYHIIGERNAKSW